MKYMMHSITRTILVALLTRNRFIVSLHCSLSAARLEWRAASSPVSDLRCGNIASCSGAAFYARLLEGSAPRLPLLRDACYLLPAACCADALTHRRGEHRCAWHPVA